MIYSKTIFRTLMAMALVLMLVGCANDIDNTDNKEGQHLLQLVPYSSAFTEGEEAAVRTRSIPSGYQKFSAMYPTPDNDYAKIAMYLARDDQKTTPSAGKYMGEFSHTSGDAWESNVYVQTKTKYYVYGFMPAGSAEASITSADYSLGAKLTLSGLSTIEPSDVCVIVGVLKGSSGDGDISTNSLNLVPGSYVYETGETDDNYIYILLDHLYARVNLKYAVDEDYDKLRTIKVTDVTLKKPSGPATVTAVATLTTDEDNPKSCVLTGDGTTAGTESVLISDTTELTTDYVDITAYCAPDADSQSFNVVTTFDVYDKDGNCVREKCTATNTITVPATTGGKSYNINMLVKPTYLYQLSGPDLDRPTIYLE